MDGLRKKRKTMNNDVDDEDVKMETFFALIRNVKDIRDRLLGLHGSSDRAKPTTTTTTTTATATMRATMVVETDEAKDIRIDNKIWQPSFKPEDFGETGVVKAGLSGGNCMSLEKTSNEEDDEDVDERVMSNKQNGDNSNHQSKDDARIVLDLNLSL